EKADSFTIGTVWSPRFNSPMFRTLNLSIDYYNIKLRDAIGTVSLTQILPRCFNFDGLSNPSYSVNNIFCQQITRDPRSGAISFGREGALNLATY
ncbi:TonB-dependent receptor, partial [Enterobacter hormaechei]